MLRTDGFLHAIRMQRDAVPFWSSYPFAILAIHGLDELAFDDRVTFLIGENGSGKSTLIEAIAKLAGMNPEGGSRNFNFSTRSSESALHTYLRPIRRGRRERDSFFLRAESYFNVATEVERLGVLDNYGPNALIYQLDEDGIRQVRYEDTEHYQITHEFLSSPARYFKHLFGDPKKSES